MNQPVLSFRESFWLQWRWLMSSCGAVCLGVMCVLSAVGLVSGWEHHLQMVLIWSLVNALWLGLLEALCVWLNPVFVAADGLKSYDAFGRYHFAPWPTIEGVRRSNFLGAR